jgi:hypothetical protein
MASKNVGSAAVVVVRANGPEVAQGGPEMSLPESNPRKRRMGYRLYPNAEGRRFDPDWSPLVAVGVVLWLVVVGVGAWFFWNAVV